MSFQDKLDQYSDPKTDTPDIKVGHAKILSNYTDGSDEWIAARKTGIGGSDAATIIGMKPYGNTREELWEEKTGRQERRIGNAATRFGSTIEPYIRLWLTKRAEDTPAIYEEFATLIDFPYQMAHPDRLWQKGNVDGLILEPDENTNHVGVEIKNSSVRYQHPKKTWTDEGVLDIHYAQIQHYMEALGLDRFKYVYFEPPSNRAFLLSHADFLKMEYGADDLTAYYLHLIDEGDVHICDVERDQSYIDLLNKAEEKFWEHVETDTRPEELDPEGSVRIEDPKLADLLESYGRAHAEIKAAKAPKEAKKKKEDAKKKIKARAAAISAAHDDAKEILVGDDRVYWHGRGYWVADPKDREVSKKPSTFEKSDLPF